MTLLGRLFLTLLRTLWYNGDHPPFAEARLRFHVLLHDLDFNLHVNNARYLAFMDLGRLDLLNRMGVLRLGFRQKWLPVLGGIVIRYHRPLHLLQEFDLVTRVIGWDQKWFYLEQRFEKGGKPVATALARALFRAPGRSVPPSEVLAAIGVTLNSPELPPEIAGFGD